jgi:hypothetical protein
LYVQHQLFIVGEEEAEMLFFLFLFMVADWLVLLDQMVNE